jgi:hypothetical protein
MKPQVFEAASKAGPLKGMPCTVTAEPPAMRTVMPWLPPAPLVGSGKFGTLCARMHSEMASWALVPAVAF